MAKRMYFGGDTPPVSPAFDASWEVTTSAVRRTLDDAKGLPGAAYASIAQATTGNSPAGASDRLLVQYVSSPLSGNQTISGAISGQIRALESNAAADLDTQMVIWVMKADGTSRGTLIASDGTALAHEWNTALRNISLPKGGSTVPTTVNALDTDRIVVELGYRKHENAVTSRTGTVESGAPSGTDLPVDETTTTQGVPWLEFADNLVFAGGKARVTQDALEAAVVPDNAKARVTQDALEAAVLPNNAKARVTQVALEVVVFPFRPAQVQAIIVG